jgi:hypothetical protein
VRGWREGGRAKENEGCISKGTLLVRDSCGICAHIKTQKEDIAFLKRFNRFQGC